MHFYLFVRINSFHITLCRTHISISELCTTVPSFIKAAEIHMSVGCPKGRLETHTKGLACRLVKNGPSKDKNVYVMYCGFGKCADWTSTWKHELLQAGTAIFLLNSMAENSNKTLKEVQQLLKNINQKVNDVTFYTLF